MADEKPDRQDKTEPASERKLRQARLDGQVARSRDFGHLMIMGSTLLTLALVASSLSGSAEALMAKGLSFDALMLSTTAIVTERWNELLIDGLMLVVPVGFAGLVGGIFSALVPGGLTWSLKALKPKWERLNPLQGLQRLVSRNHLIDSVKLTCLVGCLTLIAGAYVYWRFDQIGHMTRVPLEPSLSFGSEMLFIGALLMLLLLLVVALVDVPLQFFRHHAEMRMTIKEARQEHKESEGDPHLRARIRERQRELGRARMMSEIPSADVIVTNPSHYSVALRYKDGEMRAPVVVAKGVDSLAFRIREIGQANDVPLIEMPPLARALHAHVDLDAEVPEALYLAVAQVLAYVYQLKRHMPGMPWPDSPDPSLVPAALDPAAAQGAG